MRWKETFFEGQQVELENVDSRNGSWCEGGRRLAAPVAACEIGDVIKQVAAVERGEAAGPVAVCGCRGRDWPSSDS